MEAPPTAQELRVKVEGLKEQLATDRRKTEQALLLLSFLDAEVKRLRKGLGYEQSVDDEVIKAKSGEVVKEGYLEFKETLKGDWAKGYFKLEWKRALSYYEEPGGEAPIWRIPLVNARCFGLVELNAEIKPMIFSLRTETGDLVLRASTDEEKSDWVKPLKDSTFKGQLTPEERDELWERAGSQFLGRTPDELKDKAALKKQK